MDFFTREEHEMWLSRLRGIAYKWSRRYDNIDQDEAFSELLVAYGTACTDYKPEMNVPFDNYFYFHKQNALRALLRHSAYNTDDSDMICTCLCEDPEVSRQAFDVILLKLTVEELRNDISVVLDYVLNVGMKSNLATRSCHMVAKEVAEAYHWTGYRAKKATRELAQLYMEYCVA